MGELEVIERDKAEQVPAGQPAVFEKLRELTRGGYLPDPVEDPSRRGILLHHESAPDLILLPDGSIDLPTRQRARTPASAPESAKAKRISWRRTFLVTVITVAVWFLSVALAASFLEMIVD
jgi:hypothetical protein